MIYVLAFLFLALMVFLYFQTKQFLAVVTHLSKVLSDLKAFTLGSLPVEKPNVALFTQPSDPDFGLGKVLEESDEALEDKDTNPRDEGF